MFTLNCNGKLLVVDKPAVMGILNTTPDSFYQRSRVQEDTVLEQAERMLQQGAGILDIGGQSTRPGSERVSTDEELRRVIPAISSIMERFPDAILSIDTYNARVAEEAVKAGACMVNDISSGSMDAKMLLTVGKLRVPYVCMHMQCTPETMQKDPVYDNVTKDVLDFFIAQIARCVKAGIHDIILDPGFGFGKTMRHNFELMKNLSVFGMLEKPLLLGVSRKSTIQRTLGVTADEALNGTTVLNTIGLMQGAHILRVHDVKEAVEAVKLYSETMR